MDFLYGVIVIVVIVALAIVLGRLATNRRKQSAWTGEVVKKAVSASTDEDGDQTVYFKVTVAQDGDGKKRVHKVTKDIYDRFEVGDHVVKSAGTLDWVKG